VGRGAVSRATYRVLSVEDVKAFEPPTWLAHNVIPSGSLSCLYGPPNIGKSFVALDLAHCVASDTRWLDRRVRFGSVVYVAAGEGVSGLRSRIDAWESWNQESVGACVYLTESIPLHQAVSVRKFLKSIADYDPTFVVFDTLARCMPGANENSVEDMGLAIAAADEIRSETGAAVLFVHHSGRPDDEGNIHERGSSALPAAVDTLIEVKGDLEDRERRRELVCRKQKDAERFFSISLRLKEVRRGGHKLSLVPVVN
jgi:RecA-family ATPase